MPRQRRCLPICFCFLLSFFCFPSFAQTSAFTFQGQLVSGAGNANGSYDMTFAVWDANIAGNRIAGPLTNSPVSVSNGLFSVALDFGANVFTGTNYWVEMGVRTNGGGSFATLVPRQALTPAPYALYAAQASNALYAPQAGNAQSALNANSAIYATQATTATNALNLSASSPQFNSLCPPGSIMAYVGTTAPGGWLLCNGSEASRAAYPALFAVIGAAYGPGNGLTTFNLPDCRGVFLRGLDSGRNYDTGRTLGSYQGDLFASHDHASQKFADGKFLTDSLGTGSSQAGYNVTEANGTAPHIRTDPTGGSETRPKNVSVNYIIKF
jgi:microcystin-dependent protein